MDRTMQRVNTVWNSLYELFADSGFSMAGAVAYSFVLSLFPFCIFLGAFVLYCTFEVEIQDSRYEGEVDIIINRNIPWWTGLIGLRRVKTRAKELATAIADAIKQDGNQVLKKKEF